MTTPYPPWTFGKCLRAVAYADNMPELRGLRDNIAGDHLLVIDVADVAARDRWAEWFGGATRAARSPREPAYVDGWHGWTVAIWPDSPETPGQAASAVESPPPDQADTDDEDDDRPAVLVPCQRRIVGDPHGSHTHEQSTGETVLCVGYESRRQAAAVLTPDDPALPDPDDPILPGSATCRVPHVRTGDGPSIVVRCVRRAGHLGDHADNASRQWANEYTDAAVAL